MHNSMNVSAKIRLYTDSSRAGLLRLTLYVFMSRTYIWQTVCASSYVTIVCWRSAIQERHPKYHVGYLIKRHFDTETSKSEPGTTYSRNRYRYRWNRWSFTDGLITDVFKSTSIFYVALWPNDKVDVFLAHQKCQLFICWWICPPLKKICKRRGCVHVGVATYTQS